MFIVEIVWNREFHWVTLNKKFDTKEQAQEYGEMMLNSGDGARVKKGRVVDEDTGEIVIPYV